MLTINFSPFFSRGVASSLNIRLFCCPGSYIDPASLCMIALFLLWLTLKRAAALRQLRHSPDTVSAGNLLGVDAFAQMKICILITHLCNTLLFCVTFNPRLEEFAANVPCSTS